MHDHTLGPSGTPDGRAASRPCRLCGRTSTGLHPVCFCCRLTARQLGLPLVPTVVTTEYRLGDEAHLRLRGYKDAVHHVERDHHRRALAEGLDRWLADHVELLAGGLGRWDVATPVPSTHRPGPAPVGRLIDDVPGLAGCRLDLLGRGRSVPRHLAARRDGFVPLPGVDRRALEGRRVLVVDDSVTTGARSQSAAAALRLAGARVVGVLAIGRALPAA